MYFKFKFSKILVFFLGVIHNHIGDINNMVLYKFYTAFPQALFFAFTHLQHWAIIRAIRIILSKLLRTLWGRRFI